MKTYYSYWQINGLTALLLVLTSSLTWSQDCSTVSIPFFYGTRLISDQNPAEQSNLDWSNRFWDSNSNTFTLYFNNGTSSGTASTPVKSPFYTEGTQAYFPPSANADERQHYGEEYGWVLAFKDFGYNNNGVINGPTMPFFSLYNKYSGTLRTFIYNPAGSQFYNSQKYGALLLSQYNISANCDNFSPESAILSYLTTKSDHAYLDNFTNQIQHQSSGSLAPSALTFTNEWVYADFELAGYDPQNSSKNTVLKLTYTPEAIGKINGDIQGTLEASGSVTTESQNELGNLISYGNGLKSFGEAGAAFAEGSSAISGGEAGQTKDWLKGVGNFASSLGSIPGLINTVVSLFGGQDATIQRINLSGSITASLTGSITTDGANSGYYYLGLSSQLPYNSTAGLYRPNPTISWGVYSLNKLENNDFYLICNSQQTYSTGSGPGYTKTYSLGLKASAIANKLVVNPSLGITAPYATVSFVYSSGSATEFQDLSQASIPVLTAFGGENQYIYGYDFNNVEPVKGFILKLTYFTPYNKQVTLFKYYDLPGSSDNVIDFIAGPNRSLLDGIVNQCSAPTIGGRLAATITEEKSPFTVNIFPNPSNSEMSFKYQGQSVGTTKYTIYDMIGGVVKSAEQHSSVGLNTITWDGKTTTGVQAPQGLYFVQIDLQDEKGHQKIIKKLLRN